MLERFLRAYKKGVRDAHDAFTDENGRRKDMASAPDTLAIMAKHLGQNSQMIANAVQYIDRDARLDVKDIARQIAWFKAQKLLKVEITSDQIIDKRYAVALPDH
jgi:hypothetical protein